MVSENIKEAVRKCNPQKAIYALAEVLDALQLQLQGTVNYLEGEFAKIRQDMDDLTASTGSSIEAIKAIAENALTTASGAVSTANNASTIASEALQKSNDTQDNLTALTGVVATHIKNLTESSSQSTVIIQGQRENGSTQNLPLPVASAAKAGVINSSDYIKFTEYDNRLKSLEGGAITYVVNFPNANPSQTEITTAYRTAYPNAPYPPLDGTVLMDATQTLAYRWFQNSGQWVKISEDPIGLFNLEKPGLILGSQTEGQIYPNADGTGALNGYDVIKADIATNKTAIAANTALANTKGAKLLATPSATQINVKLQDVNNNDLSEVNLGEVTTAVSGLMTPTLLTTLNNLAGGNKILKTTVNSSAYVYNAAGTRIATLGASMSNPSLSWNYEAQEYNGVGIMSYVVSGSGDPSTKQLYTTNSSTSSYLSVPIRNNTGRNMTIFFAKADHYTLIAIVTTLPSTAITPEGYITLLFEEVLQ